MQTITICPFRVVPLLLGLCLLLAACTAGTPVAEAPTVAIPTQAPPPTSTLPPTLAPTLPPTLTPTPTPILAQINQVDAVPQIVKNGDPFTLLISTSGGKLHISIDISQLDTNQKQPFTYNTTGVNPYRREFLISYANAAPNGKKPVTITAEDESGRAISTTIQMELQNAPLFYDTNQLSDDFNKTGLDTHKWGAHTWRFGSVAQKNGRLQLATVKLGIPRSTISSNWTFPGDFDIQVDFESGEGWGNPGKGCFDEARLGVEVDMHAYHITRIVCPWDNGGMWDAIMETNEKDNTGDNHIIPATTGKLRLIRIGSRLLCMYDIGNGWVQLPELSILPGQARAYLQISSNSTGKAFTTYFDNFTINSGLTQH